MKHLARSSLTLTFAVILLTQLSGCDLKTSANKNSSLADGLPSPLTVAETLAANTANQVCASGGIRLVYGLDHNNDGRVGPYESIGMEYLCNPTDSETGPQVVKVGDGVPEKQKQKYLSSFGKS